MGMHYSSKDRPHQKFRSKHGSLKFLALGSILKRPGDGKQICREGGSGGLCYIMRAPEGLGPPLSTS